MPNNVVLLANVLVPASVLRARVVVGLQALKARDIGLILESQRVHVGDSLDLDEATRELFPNDNRWDYVLSVPTKAYVIAIEPHSAKDSEVSGVIKKKQRASAFLLAHLPPKHRVARWLWVSHGRVTFSRMEKATRLLDQSGIEFVGRMLRTL